ncbi:hypothetical protein CEXT_683851 [Caerostris extrusa]|uniref:Ycf15 n=1 Tax=Caerostris extrusa TaxID=172846 RepID=A0AAV4S546_CAEEX|nr:hypothetical protein CEXT_683851 [Caerostris extrusa]
MCYLRWWKKLVFLSPRVTPINQITFHAKSIWMRISSNELSDTHSKYFNSLSEKQSIPRHFVTSREVCILRATSGRKHPGGVLTF